MDGKNEKKIKEYMENLEYNGNISYNEAYNRLSPIALEFEEGKSRTSLMQVYYSKYGWAGATNGYMMAFLPTEEHEATFGVQSTVDAHKTDELKISEEGIEIICNHKNDKSGVVEPFDLELSSPPDYFAILPKLSDCAQGNPFRAIKGDFAHKLGDCLSNDGYIKFIPEYAPKCSEKILILGRSGFGVLSTTQDEDIKTREATS